MKSKIVCLVFVVFGLLSYIKTEAQNAVDFPISIQKSSITIFDSTLRVGVIFSELQMFNQKYYIGGRSNNSNAFGIIFYDITGLSDNGGKINFFTASFFANQGQILNEIILVAPSIQVFFNRNELHTIQKSLG
jgi:hypothetical protein